MADQYLIQLQRDLLRLYDHGHTYTQAQMDALVTRHMSYMTRMVAHRRNAVANRRAVSPLGPPPPQVPPPPRIIHDLVGEPRPIAQLRPAARPVAYVRPAGQPAAQPLLQRSVIFKQKVLSKAILDAPCGSECSICYVEHFKKDSVTTDCNHEFGRECYTAWMNTPNSNRRCPVCRKHAPTVTAYRARKSRNPIQNIVA
jgi:hypothetical protein